MERTYPTKVEQPFEGDYKVYYVNGGRCYGKVNKLINELVDYINELRKENRKYKEVIDKAIEYNKKNIHSQTLYKILKGESNNENRRL